MSLESQIGSLVEAANNLTGTVAGKMQEIDQKVDQATSAVPDTIRDLSAQSFYVDAVNGDDDNPGTSSEPFRTLRGAHEKAPNGGRVVVYMRSGQVHKVDGTGIFLQTGHLQINGRWRQGDGDYAHIKYVGARYENRSGGYFAGVRSGSLLVSHCTLEADSLYEESDTESTTSTIVGYTNSNTSALFYRVKLKLTNIPISRIYSGYSARNFHIARSSIEVVSNESGLSKLTHNRNSTYHACTIDVHSTTLVGDLEWSDLIDYYSDVRNLTTNLDLLEE